MSPHFHSKDQQVRNDKTITTTEALELVERILGQGYAPTRTTLIKWLTRFDLGYQMGGGDYTRAEWRVYKRKLEDFIRGKSGIKTKRDDEAISR